MPSLTAASTAGAGLPSVSGRMATSVLTRSGGGGHRSGSGPTSFFLGLVSISMVLAASPTASPVAADAASGAGEDEEPPAGMVALAVIGTAAVLVLGALVVIKVLTYRNRLRVGFS